MKPDQITIHCSDSENGKVYPIDKLEADHKARGFKKIGYHRVIQVDGTIHETRDDNEQGAHVKGNNEGNLGVCLIGKDRFTKEQWSSLRKVLMHYIKTHDIKASRIYGHYQFDTAKEQRKTCPNVPINLILKWFFTEDETLLKEFRV